MAGGNDGDPTTNNGTQRAALSYGKNEVNSFFGPALDGHNQEFRIFGAFIVFVA